jgi:hypothetical protein
MQQFVKRFSAGWWFSPDTSVSSTDKIGCQDITEIVERGVKKAYR